MCAGTMPLPYFQPPRPFINGRSISINPRLAPIAPTATVTSGSNNKRGRKDRGPNWSQNEIFALIAAKREMHFEEKDVVDARDLMGPDSTKWLRISQEVMRAGFSPCLRDGPACKTKWNQILPEYKKISDYFGRTGRNVPNYWNLSAAECKDEGLPKQFLHDIFVAIDEWCHNRPQIQLPHVRDLLAPNDANYKPKEVQDEAEDDDTNNDNSEDPMDLATAVAGGGIADDSTDRSTPPRSPMTSSSTPRPAFQPSPSLGTPFSRAQPGLPPGVTHIILLSGKASRQHKSEKKSSF